MGFIFIAGSPLLIEMTGWQINRKARSRPQVRSYCLWTQLSAQHFRPLDPKDKADLASEPTGTFFLDMTVGTYLKDGAGNAADGPASAGHN